MTVRRIASQSPFAGRIGFSAASLTDGFVFTAGFTAVDAQGSIVGAGNAYE